MDPVNSEIKKMAEVFASLNDASKLTSAAFFKKLKGRDLKEGEDLKLIDIISLIQKRVHKSLKVIAQHTPGNSLHQVGDKKNLIRILNSIDSDLSKLSDSVQPNFFQYYFDRFRSRARNYSALSDKIVEVQVELDKKIKEINETSASLFDNTLNNIKKGMEGFIEHENDIYLAMAMKIQEKIDVIAYQNKAKKVSLEDSAVIIHKIIAEQLKNQTEERLKYIGNPSRMKKHVENLTKIFQDRLDFITGNNLFYDLPREEKAKKINAILPEGIRVNEALKIDQSVLQKNIQKKFLEPFEDKIKAEQDLFSHKRMTLLDTIKKLLVAIRSYFMDEPTLASTSNAIEIEIHDLVKKYYGKSTAEERKKLFLNSQIVADDLQQMLQRNFENSSDLQTKKDLLAPLFTEMALKKRIAHELLRQLDYTSRHNMELKFNKIAKDLEFSTHKKSEQLRAEKNKGISNSLLQYHKVEALFDSYETISDHLQDKKFLTILNAIPLDAANRELVCDLWKHMLIAAYPTKNMSHRVMLAHYKDYLLIRDHMPKELMDELELFTLEAVELIHKGIDIRTLVESNQELTKEERENIEILARGLNNEPLTPVQEHKINEFMNAIAGNTRLNKIAKELIVGKTSSLNQIIDFIFSFIADVDKLGPIGKFFVGHLQELQEKLESSPKNLETKEKSAVKFLYYFSWKTRNLDEVDKIYEKLNKNLSLIKKGKPIVEGEKITLGELSLLKGIIKLRNHIQKLKNNTIKELAANHPLFSKKIFEIANKAEAIELEIRKLYSEDLPNIYRSGDIAATDSHRYNPLRDSKLSMSDRLRKALISKYEHGAIIAKQENRFIFSEIINDHSFRTLDYTDSLVDDVWRIDASKLLEGKNLRYIIEMYRARGITDWREAIHQKYEEIADEVHSKDYSYLENRERKRNLAGLADFIPFAHKGKEIKNWKKRVKEKLFPVGNPILLDLVQFKNYLLGIKDEKKTMICSSFATQTTILALAELNEHLAKELSIHFKSKNDNKLSAHFEQTKEAFTMPYPSNLKLGTVHPGMMIDLLLKKKCLMKVEPPEILKKLFVI